jgi:predicted DNA-binding transcriptional regulator YafY
MDSAQNAKGAGGSVRGIRLSRLLQIISLFRGVTSWNAPRLAERFNTSRRNIRRDLKVLREAEVPFDYDPDYGMGGGYRIRAGWFFPTANLSEQEGLDLAVLSLCAESGTIPLLQCAPDVRDKLMAVIPQNLRERIRNACKLFEVLNAGVPHHEERREIMVAFQQALLGRKQIDAVYGTPHQKGQRNLRLQPRRVFLIAHTWYAACDDHKGKTKLYRLARFKTAKVTNRAMTAPSEFSLREFLGNAWTVFRGDKDYEIEILFTPAAALLVAEVNWHHTQELIPKPDGSLIFHATVSGLDEIKYWVLQWGPRARVTKPLELAVEVNRLARRTAELNEDIAGDGE